VPQRILVIEDDEAFRYVVTRCLTDAGFTVEDVADYRDALEIIDDGKPLDLMLTDLMIPGVNGFALARMARMRRRDLKIMHMTSFDDAPANEALGPLLHKPLDPEVIVSEVKQLLASELSPAL
jgi:two-component system cell cycle sensor histidine kinase/response regulator CckA